MVPALHPGDVPVHHAAPDVKTAVKQHVLKHVQMNVKDRQEYHAVLVQHPADSLVLMLVITLVLIIVSHHVKKYVIIRPLSIPPHVVLLRDA